MLSSFFKGFFISLLVIAIACIFWWAITAIAGLLIDAFGLVLGFVGPGVMILLVCIAVGLYYMYNHK